MSSLRAKQKIARRQQILSAARVLFVEHGYSKTNMDAIADAALVGVATIYTYFDSKEGVLAALFKQDMDEVGTAAEQVLECLPDDPAEGIIALLDTYEKALDFVSYNFMTEFIIQAKTKGAVQDAAKWNHDRQVAQIQQALEIGQKAGTISTSLDIETAAMIVIDIHYQHLNRIAGERYTQAGGHRDLEKSINTLFASWHV